MIEFVVNGTTYQAEEGMTWEEFVNSSYNDGVFYADKKASDADVHIYLSSNSGVLFNEETRNKVLASDIIEPNSSYFYQTPK